MPEIILLATVCVMFLGWAAAGERRGPGAAGLRHRWGILSLIALAVAWAIWFGGSPDLQQGALFHIDQLVWYTRGLSLSAGILLALVLWNQIDDGHAAEAHACLLAILAGTNLVAAASDLVSLFLCAGAGEHSDVRDPLSAAARSAGPRSHDQVFSAERVFVGAGAVRHELAVRRRGHDESRRDWRMQLAQHAPHDGNRMLQIAFALLLAGLCFRIAAVPFHFYAPDVFQGTTAANAALLSFVPKVVGFVACCGCCR